MLNSERVSMRAVAHPLRLQILSVLTGESLSASELGRRLDQSAANISFHLRKLLDAGLVEVVGAERIRGGVARLYRHDASAGERLHEDGDFPLLAAGMAQELGRRSTRLAPGTLPRFTDFEGWVDPDVVTEVAALAQRIGELVHEAATGPGDGRVRLAVTVASFVVQDGPGVLAGPETSEA